MMLRGARRTLLGGAVSIADGLKYAIDFNGTNTYINCGSGTSLDNIADAEFTIEAWISSDGEGRISVKGDDCNSVGWRFAVTSTKILGQIKCATTDALSIANFPSGFAHDGDWHHILMYFNDAGDRKIYLAVDGEWIDSYSAQTAGVGAIVSDAALNLYIGYTDTNTFNGSIAWVRISDNDRYSHGTDFTPPNGIPAVDANTIEQWVMDEGTGTTVAASVTTPTNDGTLANGTWSEKPEIP